MKKIFINNKFRSIVPVIMLLINAFACTKKFDDLNTRQDAIIVDNLDASKLGQMFATAEYYGLLAGAYNSAHTNGTDLWAQYSSCTQSSFTSDQFSEAGSTVDRLWTKFYSVPAPQIFFVEHFTLDHNMPLANAIAKVWKVVMYHRMTDCFGPIPYSQFGNAQTSVPYDAQKDIYNDFFKILDEATTVLKQNPGGNAYGSNDQVYAGNANKWLVFANSLRLRLALRLTYIDPAMAKLQAEKAVSDGVMINNSDNANVISTVNSIEWLSQWTYINEFRMSATMQSVLMGYNDPRVGEYFAPAKIGGTYKGIRNGLPSLLRVAVLNDSASFVATKYLPINKGGSNVPNRVMAASEVFFLRAEGALRGWNMGGISMDLYNAGIRASITERTSATTAIIDNYIVSTNTPIALNDRWKTPAMSDIPVLFDNQGNFERKLEQIITQKWISLYPDGWEAWSERRRTGYPKGYPIIASLNPNIPVTGMVRRLMFASSEISNNKAAVDNARLLLSGPDEIYTKVWWDAR